MGYWSHLSWDLAYSTSLSMTEEKAREHTLIKLPDYTGLGATSSSACGQGCHPEGPEAHCDSARTAAPGSKEPLLRPGLGPVAREQLY